MAGTRFTLTIIHIVQHDVSSVTVHFCPACWKAQHVPNSNDNKSMTFIYLLCQSSQCPKWPVDDRDDATPTKKRERKVRPERSQSSIAKHNWCLAIFIGVIATGHSKLVLLEFPLIQVTLQKSCSHSLRLGLNNT